MGIKELWGILTPFCERKPLYELQGKTVAVDLAGWICEAQNIAEYSVQPRMYLRNLYFRTCYLLLMEVTPVFVLEGAAPALKYQTIANRNEMQFKGSKPKSDKVKTGKGRTRFHFVLKQCENMLRMMGISCVTGSGEAESLCAYLNAEDLVAGCISQDSDCFAYGARVVYRNFSISHQGSYAATGGAVDIYDIRKANQILRFGRNKIIALALLCGSDYNEGVHGVGKDSAMKLLNRYADADILDRLRSWRGDLSTFAQIETKMNDKNICTSCGHAGKLQAHTRNGCAPCATTKGCDFTKYRDERLEIRNELQIRSKALADPEFPDETLVSEYLVQKDDVKQLDLKWSQPDLVNFIKFTTNFLTWEELYSFEKFLPILTRWQLLNHELVSENTAELRGVLYPDRIKKKRNPKGVKSYEIIWQDRDGCFKGLIPDQQISEYLSTGSNSLESLWSTVEPEHLVERAHPTLVLQFLESKNKGKNKKINKKPAKRSEENKPEPKHKTIDKYFVNVKKINNSFSTDFGSDLDDDVTDISAIVDEITSQEPLLPAKLTEMGYSVAELSSAEIEPVECSFFTSNLQEEDLFERTVCKFSDSDSDTDDDALVDMLARADIGSDDSVQRKRQVSEGLEDSFEVEYVPLYERLRRKNRPKTD